MMARVHFNSPNITFSFLKVLICKVGNLQYKVLCNCLLGRLVLVPTIELFTK